MVVSHFLRLESGLHISKNGFSTTMRWLSVMYPDTESDNEMTTHLKTTVASKSRAEKVKSFVRKYMESNSGKFPKATHIQKEVGGSFYTVKEVLSTLKEEILGNKQPGVDQNPNLSTPGVNPLASGLGQNSQSDTGILLDAGVNSNMEQNIENASDKATKESSSFSLMIGTTDSDVTAVDVSSSFSKLRESEENGDQPGRKVIFSKSDFLDNSRKISKLSSMFSYKTYDERAVERKNQLLQSDVVPSGTFDFVEDQVSPASKLSTFHMSIPSDPRKKLHGLFGPSRLDFSKPVSHLPENEKTIQSELDANVAKLFTGMNTCVEDMKLSKDQTLEGNEHVKSSHFIENFLNYIDERQEKEAPSVSEASKNIPSPKIDKTSRASFPPGVKLRISFPKERKTSSMFNFMRTDSNVDRPSHKASINFKAQEHKSTSPEYVSLPLANPKISAQPSLFSSKDSDDVQNNQSSAFKVVLKFLHRKINKDNIHASFQRCGDISSIELPCVEGSVYRHANIYFKKKEGLLKALRRRDIYLSSGQITIEADDVVVNGTLNRICIPDVIGDPNFPVALGKNPTRTVMIKPLTHDITSTHVESALSFCGCKVTGFFLGSSNSVAYVELETEEAKERALAKRSIDVSGKKVLISRIDVPRTTVIRIFHSTPEKNTNFYQSAGIVRHMKCRTDRIIDVYYALDEWPNMLNILNRLNEAQVDGQTILAQPATVIPPEILRALWGQQNPNGRKHVVSMMQSLLEKAEEENIMPKLKIHQLMKSFYGSES